MSTPQVTKNILFALAGVIVALVITGYVVAALSRGSIRKAMRQAAVSSGSTGIAFGGNTVAARDLPVDCHINWPFIVTGTYAVPFDLHATIHSTTFLVMPWGQYTLSSHVSHTL